MVLGARVSAAALLLAACSLQPPSETLPPASETLWPATETAAGRPERAAQHGDVTGIDRLVAGRAPMLGLRPASDERSGLVDLVRVDPYTSADRASIVVTLSGRTRVSAVDEKGGGAWAVDGSAPRVGDAKVRAPAVGRGPTRAIAVRIGRARAARWNRKVVAAGLLEAFGVEPARTGDELTLDFAFAERSHLTVFTLSDPFRVVIDAHAVRAGSSPMYVARQVERIALDPGHGGVDAGAVGPTGLREKDVTLDVAHRAASVLAHELGIATLLTRDDDRRVPLEVRTARANAFQADLFVSIHCNASTEPGAHGPSIYVLGRSRSPVELPEALRENGVPGAGSFEARPAGPLAVLLRAGAGGDDGEREPAATMRRKSFRSEAFAELLQRAAMVSAGISPEEPSGGVRTAGFFVLAGAQMPSVLFETSFISDPGEERRLATADYRQRLADAIVNAVYAYREGR